MKVLMKRVAILVTVVLFSALLVGMKRPVFKSAGINHLVNLISEPSDLRDPIVEDDCFLWEKGRSVTYPLKPKYRDFYEIGLRCDENPIPCNYVFDGKLLVEFLNDGIVVSSQTVNSILTRGFAGKDMKFDNRLELFRFSLPLDENYWDHLSLRITVIVPATALKKYEKGLKLYVSVSCTP